MNLNRTIKHYLTVALTFSLTAGTWSAPLIETIRGPHVYLTTQTLQPALGAAYVQPETGISVTRQTDISLIGGSSPSLNGNPSNGDYPGYSKFCNWSDDNSYYYALSTWPDASLWKDGHYIGLLKAKSNARIFESREPRWTGKTTLSYIDGLNTRNLCEQDVSIGPNSEKVLYTSQYPLASTGDGDWDAARRYYALVEVVRPASTGIQPIERVSVFDRQTGSALAGKPLFDLTSQTLNGVNIMPDGEFLIAETSYYKISDLRAGILSSKIAVIRGGHGGYVPDVDGKTVAVWQESADDYIWVYKPSTGERYASMYLGTGGLDWCSLHIASCKNPAFGGCYVVSTYPSGLSANSPFRNQVFIVQLGRTNKYDRPRMGTGVTDAQWATGFLPVQPKILRIASTNNLWLGYFSECAANLNLTGDKITFVGNWNQHDNLENYSMQLPVGWHELLAGGIPSPTPTPFPTQTPQANTLVADAAHRLKVSNPMHIISLDGPATATVTLIPTPLPVTKTITLYTSASLPEWGISNYGGVAQTYIAMGNSNLYRMASRGNFGSLLSMRTDTFTFNGSTITSASLLNDAGLVDCGIIARWDLSKLPKTLKIERAFAGFSGTVINAEGSNMPNGHESISVKQILNNLHSPVPWTKAYRWRAETSPTDVGAWRGASWGLSQYGPTTTTTKTWKFKRSNGVIETQTWAANLAPWNLVCTGVGRWGSGLGIFGNLSSSLQRLPNDPRISFNPDKVSISYSDDITALVQGWIDGSIDNWGVALDANDCASTDYFAPGNSPVPKYRCLVGIQPEYMGKTQLVIILKAN